MLVEHYSRCLGGCVQMRQAFELQTELTEARHPPQSAGPRQSPEGRDGEHPAWLLSQDMGLLLSD